LAEGDLRPLEAATHKGLEHWRAVGKELLALYAEQGEEVAGPVQHLLTARYLG
jgi:hypothetical protein